MSERSGTSTLAAMTLEEPGAEQASPRAPGPLRCGPCAVWPRQQTWLCAVPLVMGFVGLGLSLMLLKWIVVGSVQDYVPTDLVDTKGSIGQDPIFLSKPSAIPKGPDISTATATSVTSTTIMLSTTTPLAADGTAPVPRTRSGPPANHSANGSTANGESNRAPHLHNRVGTRVTGTAVTTSTTRTARLTPPPNSKEVTPRSTVRKGGSGSGRNGGANPRPGHTSTTVTTTESTTLTAPVKTKAQPTVSPPAAPVKPTPRWNHGRPGKGPVTRPHHRFRAPVAPTLPSLRSEVFKPCVEDKDLAFCLNEGECSIIETVAGVHRHCRCKEGYHGLRCDQFVPKTDAILSDPKSGDTYQRQVLSIFSIASGICLLGVACMALYRRNKRQREKLQAHFSDGRGLRDCSVSTSGLMPKSAPRLQYNLHFPKSCPLGSSADDGSGPPGASAAASPIPSRAPSKGKPFRSGSLSLSPAKHRRENGVFRTPPFPREKPRITAHIMEGPRMAGHVYRHLQEDEFTDSEAIKRCDSANGKVGALLSRTSLCHFPGRKGWTEVPCTRLDKETTFPPPSLRARSVPIIPSFQACDPEGGNADSGDRNKEGPLNWHLTLAGKTAEPLRCSPAGGTEGLVPASPPNRALPPAEATTNTELGKGLNPGPRSIEMEVKLPQNWEEKSFSDLESQNETCGNTLEDETVPKSDGKRFQLSSQILPPGSLQAAGHKEAQGQRQGQTRLMNAGTDTTKGPRCRGTGNPSAGPFAS
ncbi:pro-neuregulin-3, membrane-bound isoform isoform X2 [Takifugu rubripes]|uniref:pro-neuregulin-3, membrane-bound isoform isoform X2 n=1 Tax=Takifugu rubripes TaxID=31033 RepID=UPI0011459E9A|nr:pro-neuregulin-3, membrane-bound isoform-like isoform X2 [Takifugu rubripes]